ncbi:MAG: acyl-CoA thioesterase [Myxococcales bacterium]|nr:acyl-CoA thioesterase [Myxococcales bacterium]
MPPEVDVASWPIEVAVPVAWGDLDAFGHVNNTVFFRWFETARIALFRELGMLERMERDGVGPILARTHCDFRSPVSFPDTLRARTAITRLGRTSFVMAYEAWSDEQQAAVGVGEGVIVQVDYGTGDKVPLDEALRNALTGLMKRPPD